MAGTLTIDTLKASSGVLATQNGMTGIAKAWAQFTVASGGSPLTVTGSFNVSSITRTALGTFSVAFTTAMTNANYAVSGSASTGTGGSYGLVFSSFANNTTNPVAPTTSGFSCNTTYSPGSNTYYDPYYASFAVFGA